MEFPINVDVFCSDGQYGKSTAIIVDPVTEKVSFIAVSDPERLYTEYLVPVNKIAHADASSIELNATKADLEKMEKFSEAEFLDVPYYSYDRLDGVSDPMAGFFRKEHLPEGSIAVVKGMIVEATDGIVGNVGELVLHPETGKITHLVMQTGHIWGSAEVSIPVSQINRVDQMTVYLDRDKQSIETLPIVQIRRHYSKKEINQLDIEILIWVFESEGTAKQAYNALKKTAKEHSIEIRNVAILVKDEYGNTKSREIADLGPRRGGITGVITGGLMGLLAGPGGALLGAAAGAVTGSVAAKKIDRGFSSDYLEFLEEKMKPGKSSIVTLLESTHIDLLISKMVDFGGHLYHHKITDEVISELVS
jgi:uncharacterized membrane protein/sporulation protein YlmC with PRC-barrel domain